MGIFTADLNVLAMPGPSQWSTEQAFAADSDEQTIVELNTETLLDGFQPSPEAGVPLVPVVENTGNFLRPKYGLRRAPLADGDVWKGFQKTKKMLRSGIERSYPDEADANLLWRDDTKTGDFLGQITPDRTPSGWGFLLNRRAIGQKGFPWLALKDQNSGRTHEIIFDPYRCSVRTGWDTSRALVIQSAESVERLGIVGAAYMFLIRDSAVIQHLLGVKHFDVAAMVRAAIDLVHKSGQFTGSGVMEGLCIALNGREYRIDRNGSEIFIPDEFVIDDQSTVRVFSDTMAASDYEYKPAYSLEFGKDCSFKMEIASPDGGPFPLAGLLRKALWEPLSRNGALFNALDHLRPLVVDRSTFEGIRKFSTLDELLAYLSMPEQELTRKENSFVDQNGKRVANIREVVDAEGTKYTVIAVSSWKDIRPGGRADFYRNDFSAIYTFGKDGALIETKVEQDLSHMTPLHIGFGSYAIFGGPAYNSETVKNATIDVSNESGAVPITIISPEVLELTFDSITAEGKYPDLPDALLRKMIFNALISWRGMTEAERKREFELDGVRGAAKSLLSEGCIYYPYIYRDIQRQMSENNS